MTRSLFRNLWLVAMLVLLVGLLVIFKLAGSASLSIQEQQATLSANRQELENVARLSAALQELDRLTINENTATQLEILRHLGLEQNDYDVGISARSQNVIGGVPLTLRQIKVVANLSYADALKLADKLYNNRKMNLLAVDVHEPDLRKPGAEVEIIIDGTLYGIDKREVSP